MIFNLSKRELKILNKALKDLIELGLSNPQANYLHNLDQGMTTEKADKIYYKENIKYWKKKVKEDKDPLFLLYNKFFKIPGL
tara:strand:- start:1041 stop:1286 length:246 start_codon:yes stop_codon:yes gene_type:complete